MKKHCFLAASVVSAAVFVAASSPARVWACACGCGVFEVATTAMIPARPGEVIGARLGGMVFVEHDYMDQNKDWNRYSRGSDDNNADKQIRTNFITAGIHYMFDSSWGVLAELPYWNRFFSTTDANGGITHFMHAAVGDIRLRGVYSGFSTDMSSGLTFGLKLPSGDFHYPDFDRDTQIGTGSTDILLGAYHRGRLAFVEDWNWFANGQTDLSALTAGGYRPGSEINLGAGAYPDGWRRGSFMVTPVAQFIASHRWRDGGSLGHSPDSGYDRFMLSPGVEVAAGAYQVYADVAFPVYQYVNGNQLVAAPLYKLNIGYAF